MTSCCICFSVLVSIMVLITVLWNYATSLWKICCGSVFCLVYRAKDKCHSDRLGLAVLFSTMKTAFLLYLSSICLESDGVYIASTRLSTLIKKVHYIYKYAIIINNITTTVKKKQMPHVPIVNVSANESLPWLNILGSGNNVYHFIWWFDICWTIHGIGHKPSRENMTRLQQVNKVWYKVSAW